MKKLIFSLLGITCLFSQSTHAQEDALKEFLDTSITTLRAEYNTGATMGIDNLDNNSFVDNLDIDNYQDDGYEEKKQEYKPNKDRSLSFDEGDLGKVMSFLFRFFGVLSLCRLIGFIFWLWMLIDAARYQKKDRVGWILVLVLFHTLGAIIYLFAAKIGRKKEDRLN